MGKKFEWTMVSAIAVSVIALVALATFFFNFVLIETPEGNRGKIGIEGGNIIAIDGNVDGNISISTGESAKLSAKEREKEIILDTQQLRHPKDINAIQDDEKKSKNKVMYWGEEWGKGALAR
uniref:Uncharacterized protein n=1 Tax=Candidatus Kentrum sp. TUN TaxID=2126343 RepID=A0A450ZN70_9GAMM|nr:MAG: hypothetical protein BECKTUN1418D_GA0071000_102813 [Candidatus Kentron sp. TUN]